MLSGWPGSQAEQSPWICVALRYRIGRTAPVDTTFWKFLKLVSMKLKKLVCGATSQKTVQVESSPERESEFGIGKCNRIERMDHYYPITWPSLSLILVIKGAPSPLSTHQDSKTPSRPWQAYIKNNEAHSIDVLNTNAATSKKWRGESSVNFLLFCIWAFSGAVFRDTTRLHDQTDYASLVVMFF